MTTKELDYMKAWTIEWFRYAIKTFEKRTTGFMTVQSLIDREKFSAFLEEFVDILDEGWEEKK